MHLTILTHIPYQIIQQFYNNLIGGHMGTQKTYSRLKRNSIGKA